MHIAAENNRTEIIEILSSSGASVNAKDVVG